MPVIGAYYPRLVYNAITVDFPDTTPANGLRLAETPIVGQHRSLAGVQETLHIRQDVTVIIEYLYLDPTFLQTLRTYWKDWGAQGKQAVLTLDRFNTCGGQYEYDQYNTYFTKAELVASPFEPVRPIPGRTTIGGVSSTKYRLIFSWQQGV